MWRHSRRGSETKERGGGKEKGRKGDRRQRQADNDDDEMANANPTEGSALTALPARSGQGRKRQGQITLTKNSIIC
eukprot:3757934-Pyramimonas_sp.AAC.1